MAERFVPPFARFFTSDLKTIVGGKLYFFENGTTTPKTVYQDPFKDTAHANPVIAGTLGAPADSFPAIYLDGTYTVELKNSADVTQDGWPQDNVGGEQIQGQMDDYSSITSYSIGNLVTGSDGNRYESTSDNNLNNDPTIPANRTGYWKQIYLLGEYNSVEAYEVGEYVTYGGGLFKCTQAGTGQTPSTAFNYWLRIHNIPRWSTTASFLTSDLVIDTAGNLQKAAANSANVDPTTPSTSWDQIHEGFEWNPTKTYSSGSLVWRNGYRYYSAQSSNINNDPFTDTAFTWWKPEWVALSALSAVNRVSGGGTLVAYRNNMIMDGNSGYLLPLASTVPASGGDRGFIVISKSDIARTLYPIIARSGSDTIAYLGGTDTSFQIDTQFADAMVLFSDGVSQWSF